MFRQGVQEPTPFLGRSPRHPDQPEMSVPDRRDGLAHLFDKVLDLAVGGIGRHGLDLGDLSGGYEVGPFPIQGSNLCGKEGLTGSGESFSRFIDRVSGKTIHQGVGQRRGIRGK